MHGIKAEIIVDQVFPDFTPKVFADGRPMESQDQAISRITSALHTIAGNFREGNQTYGTLDGTRQAWVDTEARILTAMLPEKKEKSTIP